MCSFQRVEPSPLCWRTLRGNHHHIPYVELIGHIDEAWWYKNWWSTHCSQLTGTCCCSSWLASRYFCRRVLSWLLCISVWKLAARETDEFYLKLQFVSFQNLVGTLSLHCCFSKGFSYELNLKSNWVLFWCFSYSSVFVSLSASFTRLPARTCHSFYVSDRKVQPLSFWFVALMISLFASIQMD